MRCLFTSLLFILAVRAMAQHPNVDYSLPFNEPAEYGVKLFQCSNGNTLMLTFMAENGITVDVYDSTHKKAGRGIIRSQLWESGKMKNADVCGLYNMGDSVVLFLKQIVDREMGLYRIFISPKTGTKISEQKIAAHKKISGYIAMWGAGDLQKKIMVKKDARSNAYAVITEDIMAHESGQRVEVLHFSDTHQLIGRSYWDDPETPYRADYPLDLMVMGNDSVIVCLDVRGGAPRSEGEGAVFYLSVLKGNKFTHHKLEPLTRDATLLTNPVTGKFELLSLDKEKEKGMNTYYSTKLVEIDPKDFSILGKTPFDLSSLNDYWKNHYQVKRDYQGMPMGIFMNRDGTKTMLLEEITIESYKGGNLYYMGGVGMMDLDVHAKPGNAVVLAKMQRGNGYYDFLHLNKTHSDNHFEVGHVSGLFSITQTGFYSFDYLNGPSGRYVLFNDHPGNFDLSDSEYGAKMGLLQGVSESNTVCYHIVDNKVTKSYLFGKPDASFDARFADISSGNYSERNNQYAVLIIENKGGKKKAKIAWVQI